MITIFIKVEMTNATRLQVEVEMGFQIKYQIFSNCMLKGRMHDLLKLKLSFCLCDWRTRLKLLY